MCCVDPLKPPDEADLGLTGSKVRFVVSFKNGRFWQAMNDRCEHHAYAKS